MRSSMESSPREAEKNGQGSPGYRQRQHSLQHNSRIRSVLDSYIWMMCTNGANTRCALTVNADYHPL
jgi:hypothetical protein